MPKTPRWWLRGAAAALAVLRPVLRFTIIVAVVVSRGLDFVTPPALHHYHPVVLVPLLVGPLLHPLALHESRLHLQRLALPPVCVYELRRPQRRYSAHW